MEGMIAQQRGRRTRRRVRRRQRMAGLLLLPLGAILLIGAAWGGLPGIGLPDSSMIAKGALLTKEQPDMDAAGWNLMLVNRWNPIPEGYEVSLVEVAGGQQVDQRIFQPLQEMLEDAKESNWGLLPLVVSGYRTAEEQQRLYDEKTAKYRKQGFTRNEAREMAEQWVAAPGHSEHQLGLAVDIDGATYDVFLWLQENSYRYGFIFRYPGYKSEITGFANEVWHYRYVGVEAATEIYTQGLCLEEYLAVLPEAEG